MIFVRHPAPAAPANLCYGRLELGLSPEGQAQICPCVGALPPGRPVVSSPMQRCRILAERIAAPHLRGLRLDVRLAEYNFGAWEGQLWSDIPRAQSEPWTDDLLHAAPPGGERFSDLIARVEAALSEVPDDAIIVAHAGPIRAARMLVTGASFDTVFAEKIPFATPLTFERKAA